VFSNTPYNIYRCTVCKRHLIAEEKDVHVCKMLTESKIEDSILWLKDDERWYPLRPHQPKGNTDKTTDKGTEPSIDKFLANCKG
jgi:hypothetical protein